MAFKGNWDYKRIIGSVIAFSFGLVGGGYIINHEWKRAHMNKLRKEYTAEQSAKYIKEKKSNYFENIKEEAKTKAYNDLNKKKLKVDKIEENIDENDKID